MCQTVYQFTSVLCSTGTKNSENECFSKKRKKIKHANENELLLSSSGVVLEVNEREKNFYKSLRDLLE